MASLTAGTTFTDGVANDVTAAKLGALVTNATPTSGFIQDRTAETVVSVNDTLLIGDASDSNNLKRMTVANLLKAPLVSTSGTIDVLTTGTTTSTAEIVTSGTISTLNSTTGTIATLNSTTGTITNLSATTSTFLGAITGSTNVINIGGGQIYKDAAGKVGIGTTSAAYKLTVQSDGTGGSVLGSFINSTVSNDNYAQLYLGKSDFTNNCGTISYVPNSTSSLSTLRLGLYGNSDTLSINGSGNVGIGTTTAIGKFTVEAAGGGASTTPITTNSITGAGTRFAAGFYYSGTKVGGIEVTASATSYVTSSDYRLKTNLESISNGIERVKQLPVYRFNWIADQSGNKVDGFVAHEAQSIVPECVSGEKDAVDADGKPIYQGIDKSKIVPLLTAALKEAIAKIETLEAKVTALEAA